MKKSFILLATLLICVFSVQTQNKNKKQKPHKGTEIADAYFRDYSYHKAAKLYQEAIQKGDSSEHVLKRIADSYYNISNVEKSSFWFKKAITKYPKINTDYVYKYIQSLRSLGKYEEASEWIEKFKQRSFNDGRIKDDLSYSMEKHNELLNTERVYVEYKNLDINTKYADFGSFKRGDTLYFASSRVKDSIIDEKNLYEWNQEPYLDIFQVSFTQEGKDITFNESEKLASNVINTPLHESSVTITSDGKTMYFTSDNGSKAGSRRIGGKRAKDGTVNLKLFKATLQTDNTWGEIKELPFNDKSFSNGNPALSPDDKTLYFSSDREGSYGQSDLYKVKILEDDEYGEPQNLGGKINTPGRENFPFIAKDSTLYFSSDAHLNLGLYDIFESNILKKNQTNIEIKNLGAPYNSSFDDFAFSIDSTNVGYFSSNRPGGKGSDDIYSFGKFECKQLFKGYVKDKISSEPLSEVTVKVVDENGKIIQEVTSDENGYFEFKNLGCDTKYTVIGEKVIYKPDSKEFTTSSTNGDETEMELNLEPLIQDGEIVINPIFFDYNKSNIRSDAAYELENIVVVMKTHPKMKIKIESHSDSRGKASYNEKLSDRRAKSTRNYLYSRDIETNRIESAIGYGESQPLNKCVDGVKCTDAEYEKNRRSKFIITNDY